MQIAYLDTLTEDQFCHLLAIPSRDRLVRVLRYMLDEDEFLSPYGIRSLSKVHQDKPFTMTVGYSDVAEWNLSHLQVEGECYDVQYVPGESNTYLFGGNSNWRGPIWLPGEFFPAVHA